MFLNNLELPLVHFQAISMHSYSGAIFIPLLCGIFFSSFASLHNVYLAAKQFAYLFL